MIKNYQFFLKDFSNVVIFGAPNKEIISINKEYNLSTTVITSKDQSKSMDRKIINYKIFNKIDQRCIKFLKENSNFKKTLFIGISPRNIFKKETLKLFSNNFINIHNTRLPLDAGGGGFSWSIMRQDRIHNFCIHIMTEEIDGGPIIEYETSIYPKKCQLPFDFNNYNNQVFLKCYKKFIKNLIQGSKFDLKPQPHYLSRYNPRLDTETSGFIDWNMNSYDLINFIDAFDDPYKGASTYLNNGNFGKLYIKKAQLHGGDTSNHPSMAGIVSRHDKNWIVVCTKSKHMLIIEEINNSKGRNIIHLIKAGDRFHTPSSKIESGRSKRIIYNSRGKQK